MLGRRNSAGGDRHAAVAPAGAGRVAAPGRCPFARPAGSGIRDRRRGLPAARTGPSPRGYSAAVPARGSGDCLAEHAAHQAAAGPLAAEAERTRQRVRALCHHWIAQLQSELTAVEVALEEAEHVQAVRRRWAAARRIR
ncbi:V-type ATP synthase subunit D [Streptomyces sp. NPDC006510]|uniref:V-type ATP synthase subunit D n=1 Tax=Streptomyces sp. NPDC006510 TaxID=3155600 RepID=UPI0033A3AA49